MKSFLSSKLSSARQYVISVWPLWPLHSSQFCSFSGDCLPLSLQVLGPPTYFQLGLLQYFENGEVPHWCKLQSVPIRHLILGNSSEAYTQVATIAKPRSKPGLQETAASDQEAIFTQGISMFICLLKVLGEGNTSLQLRALTAIKPAL